MCCTTNALQRTDAHVLYQAKRDMFWDTQPHYGGDKGVPRFLLRGLPLQRLRGVADSPVPRTPVIWDALKAACDEPDPEMAATILDSAGVIVSKQDLSECYDAKGAARQRPLPCTVSEQVLKLARLNEALLRAGFKYELPKYVVAPPQNLRSEIKAAVAEATAPETVTRNTASAPVAAQPEPAQPVHRYDATQMVGSGTT